MAADDRLPAGTTLSHFRIVAPLGHGGMGVVYRAHDLDLGRDVALKLLPADAREDTARAALIDEARTASRLNHPHICTVYEVGQAGDHVFVAMELVEGGTLKAAIQGGGMAEESVVRHGAALARALAHAHEQRVVHRDIKSSNIVVAETGGIKLLDFGLSRRLIEDRTHDAPPATTTGVVAGTPEYLSPELLQGERAGPASDLWSLGVVLYEMCTGVPPFTGPTVAAVVTAILKSSLPPLPEHIGPGLAGVIARCLCKDPGQRYASAVEIAAALEALQSGSGRLPVPARRRVSPSMLALGLMVVLTMGTVLVFDAGGLRTRVLGGGGIRSIAVLPLESLPAGGDRAYFADGMTEQLIGDLAQVRRLRVISRTSVMRFRGAGRSLPEIAAALGVDAIVEGSVREDSGTVRIQLRLVDARTEEPLWAGRFDRPLRDVLALQSDVAREVVGHVRTHLSRAERDRLENSREVDPLAFEHYLKGRQALSRREAGTAWRHYRQAIAIDPLYARAHAGVAHAMVLAHFTGDTSVHVTGAAARAAGGRAVELDPGSADGFLALANVQASLLWDLTAAEASARRARELGPGVAEAHHTYGLLAFVGGRRAEALRELRRARELDPLNPYYHAELAEALIFARRYDEAIGELSRMLSMFPNDPTGRCHLGRAWIEKGDASRAIAELQQAPAAPSLMARALAADDRALEARALLPELEAAFAHGRATALDIAGVHAALGERDGAFTWLDRSHARREQRFLAVPFDPAFDAIRDDPRYAALALRSPWSARGR